MTGLQKQKARSHLKRFRSRKGPHVFFSSSPPLSLVSPHCSPTNDCGLHNKKEDKIPLFPGKATGKRFAICQTKDFPLRDLFPPRQVTRCPHLRDNEATDRLIVNTLHGLLNGLPCQACNSGFSARSPPPLPNQSSSPSFKYSVDRCRFLLDRNLLW